MNYREEYQRWLDAGACEPMADEKEIEECFYTDLKFGTGGIRAIMGPGPNKLNKYTIRKNTEGFARFIESKGEEAKRKGVVIACDNRRNSQFFCEEAAKVLATHDIHVYLFESLRTTPELSFAVRYLGAQGGINITASHNPPEYNGYKTYDEHGCQSVLRDTDVIIEFINSVEDVLKVNVDESKESNIEYIGIEVDEAYYKALETVQERPGAKKQIKIVYTPLHGTGNVPVRTMLHRLGYEVVPVGIQCIPDPDFSKTKSPNPENQKSFERAMELAKKVDADLIVATDPDCDRLGLVVKHNEEHVYLTGNQTGAIMLEYLLSTKKEKGTLPANGIVFDTIVTASLGAKVAQKYGVEVESTLTGFKFIGDKIREYKGQKEFLFGYEESYGYMIKPFTRDKDGVQSTILAAEAANYYKSKNKTLVDVLEGLYSEFGYLEDVQENETFPGIEGAKKIKAMVDQFRYEDIEELEGKKVVKKEDFSFGINGLPKSNVIKIWLEDESWVVVRPSGNEPKIKYYKNLWKKLEKNIDAHYNEGKIQ